MPKKIKKELTTADFVKWGKKGGAKNKEKGPDYFSKLGKKGAAKRWKTKE